MVGWRWNPTIGKSRVATRSPPAKEEDLYLGSTPGGKLRGPVECGLGMSGRNQKLGGRETCGVDGLPNVETLTGRTVRGPDWGGKSERRGPVLVGGPPEG